MSKSYPVLERSDYVCVYCGGFAGTADHVIPRALFKHRGRFGSRNIKPCCRICNSIASDWVFPDFDSKKRFILIHRFVGRDEGVEYLEFVGAKRARDLVCQ